MKISARIENAAGHNRASVQTDGRARELTLPSKSDGRGSDVNGGELLFLALATCYANDLYREAAKRDIAIDAVDVTVSGVFAGAGQAASEITYSASVASTAPESVIDELLIETDRVAEVHRTLRAGARVTLVTPQRVGAV